MNVLAIAAHPDDIEFLMAGTMLRLKDAGCQLHYLNIANGCCGSTTQRPLEIVRRRRNEARASAQKMGAVFHESLVDDIQIFYERPTLARVASIVRQVAPAMVLTHSPTDYMEDHMNACRLAVTAAFCRGMPNFPVDPPAAAVFHKTTVYHAQPYSNRDPLGRLVVPDIFVDVSDRQEEKAELLACHASQKTWLDESQGLDSYLRTMHELDAEVGAMSERFAAAEGWRRHLPVGLCDEGDDPLGEAIGTRVLKRGL